MHKNRLNRREWLAGTAGMAAAATTGRWLKAAESGDNQGFQLRYIVGSCMFGYTPIAEILPEVAKTGASAIDIWPKVHGSQREELDTYGKEQFAALLAEHNVKLGCITQYKLGPFGLQEEMKLSKRLGCELIVTGAKGPKGLEGEELKQAIDKFLEEMKPHIAAAEETGVTIAIENHGNNLIDTPDSIRWLLERCESPRPRAGDGAPYHLPQDAELLAQLIRDVGPRMKMFYAWQHGMGCMEKLPKEQELLQMPGRGELDFAPLLKAMRETNYQGWTEIFMHPVPRGVPILEPTSAVTQEINRGREYLEARL